MSRSSRLIPWLLLTLLSCGTADPNDAGAETALCHCLHAGATLCSPSNNSELMRDYCESLAPPGEFAEGDCPGDRVAGCVYPNGGREYLYAGEAGAGPELAGQIEAFRETCEDSGTFCSDAESSCP